MKAKGQIGGRYLARVRGAVAVRRLTQAVEPESFPAPRNRRPPGVTLEEGYEMMNKAIVSAIVLAVVFLAGFVPQYAKVNRLDAELRQARLGNTSAELRDLMGLAYVQANQKNYGIAAGTAARFFNRVREVANQTPDANAKKGYEDLLISRDKVTAELAKGETGVMGDLQDLFEKTRKATGASAEQ